MSEPVLETMPNSFRIPEGGPVYVMDSDEALLATRPAPADYERIEEPVAQSLPKMAIEYALTHPLATAYTLATGWGAGLADAIAPLDTYTKKIGVRLGSPMELLEHLDENPGDWFHLLGANAKLQDMIENPEDYPE